MSNTERQRQFRERNPGYYGRLHRKRKAERLKYRAVKEWCKANLQPKVQLMLPSPEQVSGAAGNDLIQQITDAVAGRDEQRCSVG